MYLVEKYISNRLYKIGIFNLVREISAITSKKCSKKGNYKHTNGERSCSNC